MYTCGVVQMGHDTLWGGASEVFDTEAAEVLNSNTAKVLNTNAENGLKTSDVHKSTDTDLDAMEKLIEELTDST